jgi:hypothetical protein
MRPSLKLIKAYRADFWEERRGQIAQRIKEGCYRWMRKIVYLIIAALIALLWAFNF